jgi:hypothetical protein
MDISLLTTYFIGIVAFLILFIAVYYYVDQKLRERKIRIGSRYTPEQARIRAIGEQARLEYQRDQQRWKRCKEGEADKLLAREMANPDSEVNQVIGAAIEEARNLNHDRVGSEHLLLVLVSPDKEKRTFLSREFEEPEKREKLWEAVERFSLAQSYSGNDPLPLSANVQQILDDGAYFVCCIGYTNIDRDVLAERLCRLNPCVGCKVLQHLGHDPYALAVAFKFETRGVV